MKIDVKMDSAWFNTYDITVQIIDDQGDLLECNHAGSEVDDVDYGTLTYDRFGDMDWHDNWQKALVCDKCGHIEDIEPEERDYDRDEY